MLESDDESVLGSDCSLSDLESETDSESSLSADPAPSTSGCGDGPRWKKEIVHSTDPFQPNDTPGGHFIAFFMKYCC